MRARRTPEDQTIRNWSARADGGPPRGHSFQYGARGAAPLTAGNRQLREERELLANPRLGLLGRRGRFRRGLPIRESHPAEYSVRRMCRLLGVSPSGYYAWSGRSASARAGANEELSVRIRAIHERSRGTYGSPRVHAELAACGTQVGRKRMARLMRAAGLEGASRRRGAVTTIWDSKVRPAPDLADRDLTAEGRYRLWVANITYIPTWAGFLYLAVVVDAWSRRVVGWSMATHLRTELVLEALNMALEQRRPREVIHHSVSRSTPRLPSAGGVGRPESGRLRARSAIALTTRYARVFSRRWSASFSTAAASRRRWRPAWRSSNFSRAGTTAPAPLGLGYLSPASLSAVRRPPDMSVRARAARFHRTVELGGSAPRPPEEGGLKPRSLVGAVPSARRNQHPDQRSWLAGWNGQCLIVLDLGRAPGCAGVGSRMRRNGRASLVVPHCGKLAVFRMKRSRSLRRNGRASRVETVARCVETIAFVCRNGRAQAV